MPRYCLHSGGDKQGGLPHAASCLRLQQKDPMSQRPNAKLTPRGRETPVSRIESVLGDAEAARQTGVSRQAAGKWLHRSGSGEGLSDRSSRPCTLAREWQHARAWDSEAGGAFAHVAHRRRKQPIGTQQLGNNGERPCSGGYGWHALAMRRQY